MSVGGRTHIPRHDHARCTTCGGCSWRCPAAVFGEIAEEPGSLRGALFSARPYPGKPAEMAPCRLACPLSQDVPAYIAAIASGDLPRAAAVIRATNALPAVCGRICIASCMRACARAIVDEGLDIRGLKRFAVEATAAVPPEPFALAENAPTVAVVGGGPAGLAAAHRLGQLGIRPVVFEAAQRAGGLIAHVTPAFILPPAALAADVAALEAQGVTIHTGVRVGEDIAWAELARDHAAVLLATGAGKGALPAIPGSRLPGVTHAIDLCRGAVEDPQQRVAGPVVVEGGGHAALQAARTARRLGARTVQVAHPLPLDLWPAGADAIACALEEGVELLPGLRVTGLVGSTALERVVVREVTWAPADGVGRPRPGPEGPPQELRASLFVASSLRRPPPGGLGLDPRPATGVLGNLVVDGGYRIDGRGWYAAGEAATGAATVVDSMATGRLAAEAIARDLAAGAARREAR